MCMHPWMFVVPYGWETTFRSGSHEIMEGSLGDCRLCLAMCVHSDCQTCDFVASRRPTRDCSFSLSSHCSGWCSTSREILTGTSLLPCRLQVSHSTCQQVMPRIAKAKEGPQLLAQFPLLWLALCLKGDSDRHILVALPAAS